jgi:hypothetical protein
MAAPTLITILGRHNLGDRWLVSAAITGGDTITATSLGLIRIDCAWLQDSGDSAELMLSTYAGSQVVLDSAIGAGTIQLLNVIGF